MWNLILQQGLEDEAMITWGVGQIKFLLWVLLKKTELSISGFDLKPTIT